MSKVNTDDALHPQHLGEGVIFLLAVACILVGALLAAVFAPAALVAALAVAFLAAFGRHARPRRPADIRAKCTPFAEMDSLGQTLIAKVLKLGGICSTDRQGLDGATGALRKSPDCGGTTNGSASPRVMNAT